MRAVRFWFFFQFGLVFLISLVSMSGLIIASSVFTLGLELPVFEVKIFWV